MSNKDDEESLPPASTALPESARTAKWRRLTGLTEKPESVDESVDDAKGKPAKWSFGVLNDKITDEVPGNFTFLLARYVLTCFCTQAQSCSCPQSKIGMSLLDFEISLLETRLLRYHLSSMQNSPRGLQGALDRPRSTREMKRNERKMGKSYSNHSQTSP